MADYLMEGYLTSPFLMIHLPEKMMTRKKVTELMMKAVILLMLLVISSHSKKLVEWPIIAGTSCANYKR